MNRPVDFENMLTPSGLRKYRRSSGMSQKAFAEKASVSYGALKKYETGDRAIPAELPLRIALNLRDFDLAAWSLRRFCRQARWCSQDIRKLAQRLMIAGPRRAGHPDNHEGGYEDGRRHGHYRENQQKERADQNQGDARHLW